MIEGEPRPTMVNKSELPKKPLKRLLAGAVNRLTDLALMTIFSGAVTATGTNNEVIPPMPRPKNSSSEMK